MGVVRHKVGVVIKISCPPTSYAYKVDPLPPFPVRCFGLGQVNGIFGKLVAVGGHKKSSENETNDVYMTLYDEQYQKWKQTIPPMPTARQSPGILNLQSVLARWNHTIFTVLSYTCS